MFPPFCPCHTARPVFHPTGPAAGHPPQHRLSFPSPGRRGPPASGRSPPPYGAPRNSSLSHPCWPWEPPGILRAVHPPPTSRARPRSEAPGPLPYHTHRKRRAVRFLKHAVFSTGSHQNGSGFPSAVPGIPCLFPSGNTGSVPDRESRIPGIC